MTSEAVTRLAAQFNRRGFQNVKVFANREQLSIAFEQELVGINSVGFGGSVTTRELGLPGLARNKGKTVWDHWHPGTDKAVAREHQLSADLFVTAVNAVTEDGIIVNADGIGNRVAASIFGPKNILFIVTPNKLSKGLTEAIARVRNIATPLNARRLGVPSPCVSDMRCHDCMDENRLDRVFVIHEYCPSGSRFIIFILNEPMGY
ncbi:MAG: lactate utilization protein [Holophagae bacterium]|nr:lactate utilization protein [Holophagae bacterium]